MGGILERIGISPNDPVLLFSLCVFLFIAGAAGKWVFGWIYKDKCADLIKAEARADKWEAKAEKYKELADAAVKTLADTVEILKRGR